MSTAATYKHGLRSLSRGMDFHKFVKKLLTKGRLISAMQFLVNRDISLADHNPKGCMEETLKRLGKVETGEMPGQSAFVKPYTISYEMVPFGVLRSA